MGRMAKRRTPAPKAREGTLPSHVVSVLAFGINSGTNPKVDGCILGIKPASARGSQLDEESIEWFWLPANPSRGPGIAIHLFLLAEKSARELGPLLTIRHEETKLVDLHESHYRPAANALFHFCDRSPSGDEPSPMPLVREAIKALFRPRGARASNRTVDLYPGEADMDFLFTETGALHSTFGIGSTSNAVVRLTRQVTRKELPRRNFPPHQLLELACTYLEGSLPPYAWIDEYLKSLSALHALPEPQIETLIMEDIEQAEPAPSNKPHSTAFRGTLQRALSLRRHIILRGPSGSGKTWMLRKLICKTDRLDTIEKVPILPVYIETKWLNAPLTTIQALLVSAISQVMSAADLDKDLATANAAPKMPRLRVAVADVADRALARDVASLLVPDSRGDCLLLLVLDGIDEAPLSVQQSIWDLLSAMPESRGWVVVSTRLLDSVASSTRFRIFDLTRVERETADNYLSSILPSRQALDIFWNRITANDILKDLAATPFYLAVLAAVADTLPDLPQGAGAQCVLTQDLAKKIDAFAASRTLPQALALAHDLREALRHVADSLVRRSSYVLPYSPDLVDALPDAHTRDAVLKFGVAAGIVSVHLPTPADHECVPWVAFTHLFWLDYFVASSLANHFSANSSRVYVRKTLKRTLTAFPRGRFLALLVEQGRELPWAREVIMLVAEVDPRRASQLLSILPSLSSTNLARDLLRRLLSRFGKYLQGNRKDFSLSQLVLKRGFQETREFQALVNLAKTAGIEQATTVYDQSPTHSLARYGAAVALASYGSAGVDRLVERATSEGLSSARPALWGLAQSEDRVVYNYLVDLLVHCCRAKSSVDDERLDFSECLVLMLSGAVRPSVDDVRNAIRRMPLSHGPQCGALIPASFDDDKLALRDLRSELPEEARWRIDDQLAFLGDSGGIGELKRRVTEGNCRGSDTLEILYSHDPVWVDRWARGEIEGDRGKTEGGRLKTGWIELLPQSYLAVAGRDVWDYVLDEIVIGGEVSALNVVGRIIRTHPGVVREYCRSIEGRVVGCEAAANRRAVVGLCAGEPGVEDVVAEILRRYREAKFFEPGAWEEDGFLRFLQEKYADHQEFGWRVLLLERVARTKSGRFLELLRERLRRDWDSIKDCIDFWDAAYVHAFTRLDASLWSSSERASRLLAELESTPECVVADPWAFWGDASRGREILYGEEFLKSALRIPDLQLQKGDWENADNVMWVLSWLRNRAEGCEFLAWDVFKKWN